MRKIFTLITILLSQVFFRAESSQLTDINLAAVNIGIIPAPNGTSGSRMSGQTPVTPNCFSTLLPSPELPSRLPLSLLDSVQRKGNDGQDAASIIPSSSTAQSSVHVD